MNKKMYHILAAMILMLFVPLMLWSETGREPMSDTVDSDREAAKALLRSIGMTVFSNEISAPDFQLSLLGSEETVSLSDYRGKVVFLNFWATWCGPCRIEMPSMEALYQDLQDEDFVLLAVNQQEREDVVSAYIAQEDYSFPVLMDYEARAGMLYGLRVIPTTYIIDADGHVVAGKIGTHIYDGERYRTLFRQLM